MRLSLAYIKLSEDILLTHGLLVHSHTHRTEIPDAYHILLSSLQQMSSRWVSMNPSLKLNSEAMDFAQGLSSQLQTLQGTMDSPSFNITASDYVTEVNRALGVQPPATSPGESQWLAERRAQQRHSIIPVGARQSHYLDTNGLRTGSDHQSPFSHTYVSHSPVTLPANLRILQVSHSFIGIYA